jgi:hypothetical protein
MYSTNILRNVHQQVLASKAHASWDIWLQTGQQQLPVSGCE